MEPRVIHPNQVTLILGSVGRIALSGAQGAGSRGRREPKHTCKHKEHLESWRPRTQRMRCKIGAECPVCLIALPWQAITLLKNTELVTPQVDASEAAHLRKLQSCFS